MSARILLAVTLLLAVGACAQAATYQLIDLGPNSQAWCINNAGQIAGMSNNRATIWSNGQAISLGTLPGFTYTCSGATSISDNGCVVGDSGHPFFWDGQMKDMPILGGRTAYAKCVNANGQIVGQSFSATGSYAAFWQRFDAAPIAISIAGGDGQGSAAGINDAGQVVGWSHDVRERAHAFLWQNGSLLDLDSREWDDSAANDINDQGMIVGDFSQYNSVLCRQERHIFVWQNGQWTDLGTQLSCSTSWGSSINNSGMIAGTSQDDVVHHYAWVWNNGTVTALPGFDSKQYCDAVSINDLGQVVGYANDVNGVEHAVLWQPVPEPSAWLTLVCGIGGGLISFRRRR